MTSPEARKQIYEALAQKGFEISVVSKDLSKPLKQLCRVAVTEELEALKGRLLQALSQGAEEIEKNGPQAGSFRHQKLALESMLKWTEGRLKMNATA
jgi:hypothetical protein